MNAYTHEFFDAVIVALKMARNMSIDGTINSGMIYYNDEELIGLAALIHIGLKSTRGVDNRTNHICNPFVGVFDGMSRDNVKYIPHTPYVIDTIPFIKHEKKEYETLLMIDSLPQQSQNLFFSYPSTGGVRSKTRKPAPKYSSLLGHYGSRNGKK